MKHLIVALMLTGPAMAQTCESVPDRSADLAALVARAQAAPDAAAGREVSNAMWEIWTDAPDAHAQDLLDAAMARREMFDYEGALAAAEALIAYCPDYAEGYNQRAFVNFLRAEYAAALPDLEKTLEITPNHVAALAGQALTLMALERNGEAALVLRRALDLNPWLNERGLLPVLEAQEKDI